MRNLQSELEEAKIMYNGWKKAERAVMSGQEYRMGSQILRRADLSEIAKRIEFWRNEVIRLENGSTSRTRVQRAVIRDL